jgi:Holliday junction DNA helicase RuvA
VLTYLAGTVHAVTTDTLTLVTYGVGREVHITPAFALQTRPGMELALHTILVVREDSLTLFGFPTPDEKSVFEVLTGISGVGPKLALAVLGVLGPAELSTAVSAGDEAALTRVPGIGKKVAARMMLELGNRLDRLPAAAAAGAPVHTAADDEVVLALTGLGWKEAEALDVVSAVRADLPEASVPVLLKASLRVLGGRQ